MKKILLIIAVFFALGSKTFANQESINKSGFISPDLKTISKLFIHKILCTGMVATVAIVL